MEDAAGVKQSFGQIFDSDSKEDFEKKAAVEFHSRGATWRLILDKAETSNGCVAILKFLTT